MFGRQDGQISYVVVFWYSKQKRRYQPQNMKSGTLRRTGELSPTKHLTTYRVVGFAVSSLETLSIVLYYLRYSLTQGR